MDALNEIEQALKATAGWGGASCIDYFESYWKPKFDEVRGLLISPELKEAIMSINPVPVEHATTASS